MLGCECSPPPWRNHVVGATFVLNESLETEKYLEKDGCGIEKMSCVSRI